ncbi:hypothetical protein [Ruminococcus sp.]|uniref:hypothetical protein n=1 Tax=Ruminococcus sp. TaxID=41978 RepID=UPI0025CC8A57|nr:hypothetical protein [Ruminococcus sp.]MBR1430310.1 hypothetical protein [Ruminococcus sp.]
MKRTFSLITAAALTLGLFSCVSPHTTKNSKPVLNDWQKEVLAAEGLPTEADQLTDAQLRSIQSIYEMITYLNDKYDEEFIYAGYLEPAANQTETLYAYPRLLGADYGRNTVTVKAAKDGFTDDYHDKSVVDYYNELVTDFIHDYFDSDDFVVFTDVNACDIKKSEVIDCDFQWKLGVFDSIFLSESICNQDDVEKFAVNFAKYLYEHKMAGRHRINIMDSDFEISEITYGNFPDYYNNEHYMGFYSIAFNTSKSKVLQTEHLGDRKQNEYNVDEYFSKYN